MKTMKTISLLVLIMLGSITTFSQTASVAKNENKKPMETKTMKTYVIEREIPGAGSLDAAQLKGISQTSCSVLKDLGPDIEWVESYVTDTKIFCIYRATNEEILRTHAQKGGFPINAVHPLSAMISPATAKN
jgi:hypothetical protein